MTVTEYYNFNLRNVLRKEAEPPPFLSVKALKFLIYGAFLLLFWLFKCLRPVFRLRGFDSRSSEELELDSTDLRLSLQIVG